MRQFSVYSASVPWPFACSLSRYLLFNVFLGLSDACVLAHIQICLCLCVCIMLAVTCYHIVTAMLFICCKLDGKNTKVVPGHR